MNISHEKYKEKVSRFYKIGYEIGFKTAIIFLMRKQEEEREQELSNYLNKIIANLLEEYNKYPCIKPIEELLNESPC